MDNHRACCPFEVSLQKSLIECTVTASSGSTFKNAGGLEAQSMVVGELDSQSISRDQELEKNEGKIPLVFDVAAQQKLSQFYCPIRKQIFIINEDDFMMEEQKPMPPAAISQSALEREQIQSSLARQTQSSRISFHPKLKEFRQSRYTVSPSLSQSIEIYALSCFLRLIGRFTREGRWKLFQGLIKKADYWEFLAQAQPWIANNKPFVDIVEEKLKYFIHDEQNYIITNFDLIFQRVKGLIENYHVNTQKLEKIFTRTINPHKNAGKRIKRKNPETLKLRKKLIFYRYRQKKERNRVKNPKSIRKLTQLKYQAIKYQIEASDEAYHMKQVFQKRPSRQHSAEVTRKKRKMMVNYCMSSIADEITAAVILGEFKIWTKSIDTIEPEQRYLYVDHIPNIPYFQIWYPVSMDILKEWKWYYPYAYERYRGQFQSSLPEFTQDQLFMKLCQWYRSKGLLIDHPLFEIEGFDEIRALFDDKYRHEQEKMRERKINMSIEVNPSIIFHENEDQSDHEQSIDEQIQFDADVPARGDPQKWKIIHQVEHLTGYKNCSVCEQPLTFPAPSCQSCLTAYHYECRNQLSSTCLCQAYLHHSSEKRNQMFNKAIADAKKYAKHIDLSVKPPPKASLMELKYQQQNLEHNMAAMTEIGLWCRPSSITYEKSELYYLNEKSVAILESFGKTSVFPGSVEKVTGKGRGVIATRDIKKNEIVAMYPGRLVTQAQIIDCYKDCQYIFNFQQGRTPFTSWAIVPEAVAHLGMFINHGTATANVTPSRFWSVKGPLLLFISLIKISMGEEILYDYGPEYHGREDFLNE